MSRKPHRPVDKRQILDMNAFDPRRDAHAAGDPVARRLANLGATSVLFYHRPIELVSGEGAWVRAADGRQYLDFYNNVLSVGHAHPAVVNAICEQSARLTISTRYLNRVLDDYLDALKQTLPGHLSNVALACTGSEANDLAARVARAVTGQRGFIVTDNAYHGNTALVTDLSPSALKTQALPGHVRAVPAPTVSNYGKAITEGFSEAVDQAARHLQAHGHGLAAVLCDSVFSSDGVFTDPPGFLGAIVDCAHRHGGLYIADEVQPGFARTGTGFWGFEHHGIQPDLVTMGKPMGNGYPMAALATRPEYFERFCRDVGYYNTFGGNPVAAAAGHAVLRVIEDEQLQQNASRAGAYLAAGLQQVGREGTQISAIRSIGLFLGIEISRERDIGQPDPDTASSIIAGLREQGVLIGAAGPFGNVLKIRPPLCTTEAELDFFLQALTRMLSDGQ